MINLRSIEEIKAFINATLKLEGDFDLISGRYIVDAKSIMGIFSLDLTQPIELKVYKYTPQVDEVIKPFLV